MVNCMMPLSILAASPASDGGAIAAQGSSVWEFVVKGGVMMIPIGACSLVMIAVLAERFMVLRKGNIIPSNFMKGLDRTLRAPVATEERRRDALHYCKSNASPIASICAAGIRRLSAPIEVIEKHLSAEGEHQVFHMRKHMRALAVVASIAPLLGLLGTILGMIRAFQTVAISGEALGKTEMLAGGIYEAMITTAAGLFVALPAIIGHHWVSAKVEHLAADMDRIAFDLVELAGDTTQSLKISAPSDNGHAGEAMSTDAPISRAPDVAVSTEA